METRTRRTRWIAQFLLAPAALVAVTTCTDRATPTGPHADGPSFAISDAAHDGGNPDFFFLPPLVGDPSGLPDFDPGAFDARLAPAVEICLLAGDACATAQPDGFPIAFTMTSGVGSDVVRVDETAEHYVVDWHTDLFALSEDESYRIHVSVGGSTLGYADVDVVSGGNQLKNVDTNEYVALKDGRTLPIKFRIELGAVALVDAEGGTVGSDDGRVVLDFPPGAVSEPIAVTVQSAVGYPVVPELVPGTVFDFGPDGAAFLEPVTLTITYDEGLVPSEGDESGLRIHKLVDGVWSQVEGSVADPAANAVSAPLNGFSVYAVLATSVPREYRMAFVSNVDGDDEIYVRSSDRADVLRITDNGVGDDSPDWSPDGRHLVFSSARGGEFDIWVMEADGSNPVNISNNPSGWDVSPEWSPTRDEIAYTANYPLAPDIVVMKPDGTGKTNLTNHPAWDIGASWSPDGSRIAFATNRDGNFEIYVMNRDGTGLQNLTNRPGADYSASWSPDGSQIAFYSDRDGEGADIWVMNADGSGAEKLTSGPAIDAFPEWTLDGNYIAFTRYPDATSHAAETWVMTRHGFGKTQWFAFGGETVKPAFGRWELAPVVITVIEEIGVDDGPGVAGPARVDVPETITVMDVVGVFPPVVIVVPETITVSDTPVVSN